MKKPWDLALSSANFALGLDTDEEVVVVLMMATIINQISPKWDFYGAGS